jgi:hypothetical protein
MNQLGRGSRRFPPPWIVEELDDACFVVSDSAGQKLTYIYYEEEPGAAMSGQVAQQRRGKADCREHRQAARAVAPGTPSQPLNPFSERPAARHQYR